MSDLTFNQRFPVIAQKFTDEGSALLRRAHLVDDDTWFLIWQADLLMRRTISHREKVDLFTSYKFWRTFVAFSEVLNKMAGKTRKPEVNQNERPEWKGFLDRRLTPDELAALDESKPKPSDLWAAVDTIIEDGYRFMLSYNRKTKLASVTLTDDNPERKTAGYALSSSDVDGASALKMAVYKHMVLLERDWTPLIEQAPKARRG